MIFDIGRKSPSAHVDFVREGLWFMASHLQLVNIRAIIRARFDDFIPDREHGGNILGLVFADFQHHHPGLFYYQSMLSCHRRPQRLILAVCEKPTATAAGFSSYGGEYHQIMFFEYAS